MPRYTLPDGIYLNADRLLGEADARFVEGNRWGLYYSPDHLPHHGAPLPAHATEWTRLADLPELTKDTR